MPTLYIAPTVNFFSTILNGSINDSQTSGITLSSVTGLQAPGVLILDREDGSGSATPLAREIITFTGISGSELTGVARGAEGSTNRPHSDAALVESTPTVGLWNSLATILATTVTSDGYLRAIASPVSIAQIQSSIVYTSVASIGIGHFSNRLSVSGASITGIGLHPVWNIVGSYSGPTTMIANPVPMPQPSTFQFFNFITRTVASGASAIIDINKNGTSIFEAGTRPYITGGGTFLSSASINVKTFNSGDVFTLDYDGPGGHITDFTVTGRAA